MWRSRAGERIRRVRNLTPRASSSASTGWVVTFWSVTSMCGSAPLAAFQWSQKAMTSRFWVALDRSALAQEEVVGAAVLGEEGQHGAGALRAGGHVVLFQGRIRTPGHDGVEVQVEDRFLAGGQPTGDHRCVQGGEERALVLVAGAVGVVGQRGLLRQRGQRGEQRGGRVAQQQVIDVGHPPGPGQFQRQQAQQPAGGGHDPTKWLQTECTLVHIKVRFFAGEDDCASMAREV